MSVVTPRPDNEYTVSSTWASKAQAQKWALGAAEETCKQRKMRYVVLAEEFTYQGMVPDRVNRIMDVAPPPGPLSGLSLRSKTDHGVQLTFRCEA